MYKLFTKFKIDDHLIEKLVNLDYPKILRLNDAFTAARGKTILYKGFHYIPPETFLCLFERMPRRFHDKIIRHYSPSFTAKCRSILKRDDQTHLIAYVVGSGDKRVFVCHEVDRTVYFTPLASGGRVKAE
ncbi:hypothetical protein AN958_00087 [Leucoagaricus sp. SymC.cos]|nr:hypothetical protein AN958_00087 [Leucoagaricus sp. SymC.cos]